MKKFILPLIGIGLCISLSGCLYSSVNAAYIKSDNVTVFGPWGYVNCGTGSSILLYRAMNATGKTNKTDFPGWPVMPTIQEDHNSNLNVGKPSRSMPMPPINSISATSSPGLSTSNSTVSTPTK